MKTGNVKISVKIHNVEVVVEGVSESSALEGAIHKLIEKALDTHQKTMEINEGFQIKP